MDFNELTDLIAKESKNTDSFIESSQTVEKAVFETSKSDFLKIIAEIGVIPETIDHDSSEEKLFAKATDIVMARAFNEIGISATVIKERANCADVIGKSKIHNYTLVGDAKAFRLSRTAKNQKDFKVKSMVDWKGDNDFAILACPYFQYPKSNSQIYGQALDGNVCLFSWEQFCFLLENDIKETKSLSLAPIWDISRILSETVIISEKNKRFNFSETGIEHFCETLGVERTAWDDNLLVSRDLIIERGEGEINYWETKIEEVKNYTREKAIKELLVSLKLKEKISSIRKYIDSLRTDEE